MNFEDFYVQNEVPIFEIQKSIDVMPDFIRLN